MSFNAGMNVSRRLIGGSTVNQIDVRQSSVNASPPVLQKAVVVDVIYDPTTIIPALRERLQEQVSNYELINVMPVNSIVAQIISDDGGTSANSYTILFPFFSSHFMLPVQVGEIVHVIYQDYVGRGNKLGFWMSRIHGNRSVEDANYTHLDRQYDPLNNISNWTTENIDNIQSSPIPGFPNGGGTIDTFSIVPFDNVRNPYDEFLSTAVAAQLQTPEVVPRWNKRPQEFVLQGANNALIVLGEDRSGAALNDQESSTADSKGYAGTIDIVVGRGRFLPEDSSSDPELTAPRIIKNSRGNKETDKAPFRNKNQNGRIQDNPNEGNPDFINDAARLYVTMQSVADNKFGIASINFPASTLPITQPTNENNEGTVNRSYVAGKADHIRFISRKNSDKGIEGTMLFLREGEPSTEDGDKDLSYMFFDKNGINIESNKIFLGTAAHENPNESNNINYNDDEGPYEPWILWSKYKDTVDSLQKQITDLQSKHEKAIKDLRTEVANSFSMLANAFAGGGNSIPYGPNSAVVAGQVAAIQAQAKISIVSEAPLSEIKNSLSSDQNSNITDNVSKINHSQKIYGSKGGNG